MTTALCPVSRASSSAPVLRVRRFVLSVNLLFTATLLVIMLCPHSAVAAEKVRLQLKWQHQFQFAGYYAAQAQGYYKAAGLDVEIIPSQPGQDPVQQVLQGEAEFGVGSTELLLLREQGEPVVVLAVIFQHSPLVLMTLKHNNIQSIHDLAGSKIMIEPGSSELYALLNKEGISSDKFTLLPHGFHVGDLLAGDVNAMSAYVTDEPFELSKSGRDYLLYSPRSVGIDFYGDNLFTTESLLKMNPEMVKAFREASLKGWTYAMNHPEELVQLIHSHYSQRHSIEHLRFEARQMVPLLQPALVEMGHMNPGRWQHIAETYAELGMMKPNFSLDGFLYDPHPLPPDLKWLYAFMGLAILIIAGVSLLAAYIYKINAQLRNDVTERNRAEAALKESEERYRQFFTVSRDCVFIYSPEGHLIDFNDATMEMFGYKDRKDVTGVAIPSIYAQSEERAELLALLERDGYVKEFPMQMKRRDGSLFDSLLTVATLKNPDGTLKAYIGTVRDITERKRAEEALAHNERRYRSLWESANEGFCLHELVRDESGRVVDYRILEVNPAYEHILGLSSDEVVGRLVTEAYQTDDPPYLDIYTEVVETGIPQNMDVNFEPMKRHFSVSVFCTGPNMFATAFSDITDRKQAEARLEEALIAANEYAEQALLARAQTEEKAVELSHQSNHDTLTSLPNRHYFENYLNECMTVRRGKATKPLTVLFVDLDKFKLINDTLGHKVGDLLLIEVADRMQSCLRAEDLLARMGGDEFTIILPDCQDRGVAEHVASRIITKISGPVEIEGNRFVIGASIGMASYPSDGLDSVTLLKHADAAMYKAKHAGRGTFRWYTGDIDKDNQARVEIEMDIRAAIEGGQFRVYYQPIVSLSDGQVHATEALLRWEHPEKGMISPSLFIPIAAEIGVIRQIGDYVLNTACAQAKAWQDEGIPISKICVNISATQAHDPEWLPLLDSALEQTGLDPDCLILELTETDFSADHEYLSSCLKEARGRGIGVAIDDFGMGYSSLSRLKDFPVVHLKIDGSFVRNIEHNESDKTLLRSIISMAQNQGIKVTAEWVETEAQMDILRECGCDFVQGYYISPALAPEQFREFALEYQSLPPTQDLAA